MAFLRFIEKMNRFLVPIGMVGLLVMMTVVSINVIGRAFFRAPLFGTVEIVELSGVILVSCILAYTQFQKENITVDALIDKFPPRLRVITDCFNQLLCLVTVAALVWTGSVRALEMMRVDEITVIFRIAKAPFRFVWVFGCITVFLVFLAQFIESLAKIIKQGD